MRFTLQSIEDVQLIERLYEEHGKMLYYSAFRILRDRSLAEDALHQTFIKIIPNIHKIDENDKVKTRNFLLIVCRNVALNMLKERNRINGSCEAADERELQDYSYDPSKIVIDKDSTKRIYNVVKSLPTIYMDVLTLKIEYHYTRDEIAEILDIQPNNVKKRLAVARGKVAHALEKEGLV